jgi:ketosteroid isomerase-like protein
MTIIQPTQTGRDLVVGLYTALLTGDRPAVHAVLHPDVVLHVPGGHPLAGDHAGRDDVVAFVAASSAAADRTEHVEVLDLLEGDDHVAALCLVTGLRDGRPALTNRTVHLFRVEGHRIAEVWFHNWDQAAVDAFWS